MAYVERTFYNNYDMGTYDFQTFCAELYLILRSEIAVDGINFTDDHCTIESAGRQFAFRSEDVTGVTADDFLGTVLSHLRI